MTREDFSGACQPATFRPFKLRLVGDIAYDITHPEQLFLHPYSRTSFSVALTDGSTHHLNLNLVTALEFSPDDDQTQGNGQVA